MQYHQNGYVPGDPSIQPKADDLEMSPSEVDVLIVGCGPAGLTLAAQLSAFGNVVTRIIEQKDGPLQVGQADGIACRSVEIFQAFGFADQVKREAYWVNEVAFWRPDANGHLARAERIPDVEDGLSEMPHVILNQARVHDFFLDVMQKSPRRLVPDYQTTLLSIARDDAASYPLMATVETPQGKDVIHARYIVGCDGARSAVRKAMGLALKGQAARQLWGVMDILADTDFPDIRLKVPVQSASDGSLLIIPREGGHMVRFYIELDALGEGERAKDRNLTPEVLIAKAQAILSPFTLDVKEVAWWSAYEIGQRCCDRFDDGTASQPPRVFIAGDACHTHSPKAGQGMNVSMADAFNLGWKLGAVVQGHAQERLLETYNTERQAKAQELIDFDRDMARIFSTKPKNAEEAAEFQRYFQKHGRYTAGVETCYAPSLITADAAHQHLATGLPIGKRFHSTPVIRLADAKPMHLAHAFPADGRWRLVAFAPATQPVEALAALCDGITALKLNPFPDVRAVLQAVHQNHTWTEMPPLLRPKVGTLALTDYEKVFCPDPRSDIFDQRGINRETGVLVAVRPDQHVAHILPFSDANALGAFFAAFM